MSKKRKRLLYSKAKFSEGDGATLLEDYVRTAYAQLPLVVDRRFEFKQKTWTGTFFQDLNNAFAFQFSAAIPGEAATTIPTGNLNVQSVELNSLEAPNGYEFSDGDMICLVSGDNIFSCGCILRDTYIELYLKELFTQSDLDERSKSVIICRPADFDKIRMINNAGVKSIELKANLSGAQFERLDQLRGNNILRKILKSFTREDRNLVESGHRAGSVFTIGITGGNVVDGENPRWLTDEALTTIADEDSYKIVTKDGMIITESQITIAKYAQMEPFGKSVFINEAIQKLEEFKNDFLAP